MSTSISSPTTFPRRALPIGDSFDILDSEGSASAEPTIVYSSSSTSSVSASLNSILTTEPTVTRFVSIELSSIITATLSIFSSFNIEPAHS